MYSCRLRQRGHRALAVVVAGRVNENVGPPGRPHRGDRFCTDHVDVDAGLGGGLEDLAASPTRPATPTDGDRRLASRSCATPEMMAFSIRLPPTCRSRALLTQVPSRLVKGITARDGTPYRPAYSTIAAHQDLRTAAATRISSS